MASGRCLRRTTHGCGYSSDDEEEQAVLAQLKEWGAQGVGITEMANRLNADGKKPPQGEK